MRVKGDGRMQAKEAMARQMTATTDKGILQPGARLRLLGFGLAMMLALGTAVPPAMANATPWEAFLP